MQRRDFLHLGLGATAAAIGCASPTPKSALCGGVQHPLPSPPTPAVAKIVYFARFGVDEKMIKETLATALSRGGDYADVFFQHKVSRVMAVEDGEVNRAFASADLGAGVRVVRGDQTGYAFTEDLTVESLRNAASTAAAIADGPSRPGPESFRADPGPTGKFPDRYKLVRAWEEVRAEEKLPMLVSLNERTFKADARIKKVSLGVSDEYGAVLVADSDGRLVEDLQPMTSMWLSCVAEQNGRREQNGYNVAGRNGFDFYSEDRLSRVVREAVARTVVLFEAVQPPRARCLSSWQPGRVASSSTRPSATAWRPTSTARTCRSTPTRWQAGRQAS
jgi:TldD protein